MKIALAQVNPVVGDIEHNFNLIVEAIKRARQAKAELIIFPELVLLGYPPKDLLLKESFVKEQNYYLAELALYSDDDFAIIVGAGSSNGSLGKKLFNSLVFMHQGKCEHTAHKSLLPNYDVFDETRYFESSEKASIIEYKGIKFGLSICEDIWIEAYPSLYHKDPIADMVAQGAEVILNAAASPFVTDKPERRKRLLANAAKKYKRPILYVNQVGANDQLIFDGASLVIDGRAEIAHELKSFEEDMLIFDSADLKIKEIHSSQALEPVDLKPSIEEQDAIDFAKLKQALVLGIKDFVHKTGFKKVIVGLSGGVDSALVAALAVEALGKENVYAVSMPSKYSSDHSVTDAVALARNLGLLANKNEPEKTKILKGDHFEIISIKALHDCMHGLILNLDDYADENMQPRLRANILMTLSNSIRAMLLNTGNKSEVAVGYSTIYGDTCGGLAVIGDLFKTTVYKLCDFINKDQEIIPQSILDKPPSAELKPGQLDQDTLPDYDVLDKIILLYIQEMKSLNEIVDAGFEKETVAKVLNMIDRSEFKRQQLPPSLKIAGKAFGSGRRMSIAQGYKHKERDFNAK